MPCVCCEASNQGTQQAETTSEAKLCAWRSVGTILFTAIGISLVVIAGHGAFRVPDDLFLDDGEVRILQHLLHTLQMTFADDTRASWAAFVSFKCHTCAATAHRVAARMRRTRPTTMPWPV